jgi:CelD/BcsL family acetyltransferase involved in cellulose biosynthesis
MVVITPLPSLVEVERLWRTVMSTASHSFFLSWPWIRTWLACLPHELTPRLLSVTSESGAIVAVALLVRRTLRRRGLVPTRTWILNATGDPNLDQIFIEQNGLLVDDQHAAFAWSSWADCFIREHGDWDEIQLRGVPPAVLGAWDHPTLQFEKEMSMTGRYVDLKAIRARGTPYINSMAKKRRARVRYTREMLEQLGEIKLEVASSKREAFEYFRQLRELHQRRWEERKEPGAFGFPFFEHFHSQLIETHFDEGVIQLLRLRAGDMVVGVLYNFLHNGMVTVYQTGFSYAHIQQANRESPGLLTHALAIQHNAERGFDRYDLLAGDSEYKRALADGSEDLWWGRIQRKRLKFYAEAGLRRAWRQLARRAPPPAVTGLHTVPDGG